MSTWTKQPAIQGQQQPCLHAGVTESVFPMDGLVAVGFGCAMVSCDGQPMLDEQDSDKDITGQDAEDLALQDPDHDWRIVLESPLSERIYQRHDTGRWVLIEQGEGFA